MLIAAPSGCAPNANSDFRITVGFYRVFFIGSQADSNAFHFTAISGLYLNLSLARDLRDITQYCPVSERYAEDNAPFINKNRQFLYEVSNRSTVRLRVSTAQFKMSSVLVLV